MKVLFVIGSLDIGGTELQMAMLASALAERGVRCAVCALDATGPLSKRLELAGIAVYDGGYRSRETVWWKIPMLLHALARLIHLSKSLRPDVLHAFLPMTNLLGSVAGRVAGVRCIVTSRRGLGTHQDHHPLWKPMDRLSNALSHAVTANSLAVIADTVRRDKADPKLVHLIRNGIDFSRMNMAADMREARRAELGMASSDLGVGVVGNLILYKGHVDLLRAAPGILFCHPETRFFFIGEDRGMRMTLSELAEAGGISERVVFLGQRDDVPELLAAMDLFILPSHEEGFSNALLEAMASGLPVIATEVGGNAEALEDGALGFLVPPHTPRDLEVAALYLLDNINLRKDIGRRSWERVREKYSIKNMVDSHLNLYHKFL